MARNNPMMGERTITLADGRQFTLVFDFNTWVDVEDRTGLKPDELIAQLTAKPKPTLSMKHMRTFFHCGLAEHHPDMSERDAGKILVEAMEQFNQALGDSMPPADPVTDEDGEDGEEADADPPKPDAGAGTSS